MGWFGDTVDFFHMMVSPTYTPAVYKESAIGKSQEQLADMKKRSDEKTARIQAAARETETGVMTVIEAPEVIAGAVASGGESLQWDAAFGTFTEDAVNKILEKRGEAPVQSLHARFGVIGGDQHYQDGGSPDDHPDRPKTGSHETGFVSPFEQLSAVKDVGVDIAHMPGNMYEMAHNYFNPPKDDDSDDVPTRGILKIAPRDDNNVSADDKQPDNDNISAQNVAIDSRVNSNGAPAQNVSGDPQTSESSSPAADFFKYILNAIANLFSVPSGTSPQTTAASGNPLTARGAQTSMSVNSLWVIPNTSQNLQGKGR